MSRGSEPKFLPVICPSEKIFGAERITGDSGAGEFIAGSAGGSAGLALAANGKGVAAAAPSSAILMMAEKAGEKSGVMTLPDR